MSYILDALRRAERERREGQAPVLETDSRRASPVTASDTLRRWIPGLLIAIAVLLALVVGLLLHRPGEGTQPSVIVVKPTDNPASPVAEAPAAQPAPPPIATAPAPARPSAPAATLRLAPSLATEPAAAAAAAVAQLPAEPDTGNGVPPLPPAAVAPAQAPATASLQAEAEAPDLTPQTPAAPVRHHRLRPAPPPPVAQSRAGTAPAVTARQLSQMPQPYRASFPQIAVDVHVFDDDPMRRFVIIAGQRYAEGETLSNGPRLVQIVPEGMVLDWQGQRVLYALAR